MKIEVFNIWRFSLRLAKALSLGGGIYDRREGFLIEMIDSKGNSGWGETAPLPEFSSETLDEALAQLKRVRMNLLGTESPFPDDEGNALFTVQFITDTMPWECLAPSVQFGLDSAWMTLLGSESGMNPSHLLCASPRETVPVNALLTGHPDRVLSELTELLERGFHSFKLKVGRQSLEDDITLVRSVRDQIGEASLRLDCNRAWSVEETIVFWDAIHDSQIDYIEEPLKAYDDYKELTSIQIGTLEVPLALDESLHDISPLEMFSIPNLKAIVLKPTMHGLKNTWLFTEFAKRNSVMLVISSSFESSVGLSALAQIAAAVNESDEPAGLGTLRWFAEDILTEPVRIENGEIRIAGLPDVQKTLRRDLLKPELIVGDRE